MGQQDERAFEIYIQETLFDKNNWIKGSNQEWDKEEAIFPNYIISFIKKTQESLWNELEKMHSSALEGLLLKTLIKELNLKGTIHLLRHGFKFYGKVIKLAFFKPAHCLNQEVIDLYEKNDLYVIRQIPCHPNDTKTIDLVFSLNGIPVATCELKNPSTGQNWRHAIKQYQNDRDPNAPLFSFKKRALVHFAVDPDEVYMTTELMRNRTHFLPFNRGSNPGEIQCGAGNPQHNSGHRTGYFWEEILAKDVFLDILGHYVFIEKKEEKYFDKKKQPRIRTKERIIFPRFHQLDAVTKLLSRSKEEGVGNNYLIQHSAGSGKTNSISWLSHRLASLHDNDDKKIFNCVLVITDRQVLDRQLQDAIYQIEHAQGVVKAIDENSKQLAEALVDGTRIVITTLQKFPFVLKGLLKTAGAESQDKVTDEQRKQAEDWQEKISNRNYAVIVDEAHSSQTGETARELKSILGSSETDDSELDWEDGLNAIMASRGRQPNLSFFAFTATPKGKTLELFGQVGASGKKEATHLYSMRQAIEEGFILDVVKNYTTYDTYFKLVKAATDNPDLPKKKALKELGKFMSLHPHNIEQKIQIIIEHFRNHIMHHLNGQAKAMVTTASRLHAVRYMVAFQKYIDEKGYSREIKPLVAFSGKVIDKDVIDPATGQAMTYTEVGMNKDSDGNSISEKQLPEKFASPDYQVLLVANKYQTGFDQPLLYAMYVDKKLDGVQAVQTLSRLNRMIPGKETPFVLDFVNKADDIYKAFKPYYDATSLQESADPQQLENLKYELDQKQIYHWSEVEAFAKVFYKSSEHQSVTDHAQFEKHLNPAKDRFMAIKDEKKRAEFKDKLGAYVRLYSFLSQVMPYSDATLEMLFSYGRLLLPKLQVNNPNEAVKLSDEIALQYFRIQRTFSGQIDLDTGDIEGVRGPTTVGGGQKDDEKLPLAEIITTLNERFSTNFTEEDRLFFEQVKERASKNQKIIDTALANPLDKFQLGIKKAIEEVMIDRMSQNDKIVTRYLDDPKFQSTAFSILAKAIFDQVHLDKKDEND